jgi:hypothetical protein
LNDTYADFDKADFEVEDPSETKDDYDSENDDHIKRNIIVSILNNFIILFRFLKKLAITKL